MTEQITVPKQTWDAVVEALELAMENLRPHGDNCFLHDEGEYNACFCGKDSLVDHLRSVVESATLTAANAVSEQQGEAARLKAFLHKHKSSALPEGACVTCEGEGEIGGQFCGGFQECSDCAGTGKKSAPPPSHRASRIQAGAGGAHAGNVSGGLG